MRRWSDLSPDPGLLAALDKADRLRGQRSRLIREGSASDKNNWSNTFADECARMVAEELRGHPLSKSKVVMPTSDGSAEPPTITYWERGEQKRKKIDILVGDLVAGLQAAVSLKGVGFRDKSSLGFAKNVTGRLYELENEARRLHEYRPQAVVVGLYFVPLGAVDDKKTDRTPSGFADIAVSLRRLTGRSDKHRQDEWHRVDLGFVALYSPGEHEEFETGPDEARFVYDDPVPRGVVRYFDVRDTPPYRGRPVVDETYSLAEMVEIIGGAVIGPTSSETSWADAEPDG